MLTYNESKGSGTRVSTSIPGTVQQMLPMSCRNDFLPIPGTKRVKYLEENAKAVDYTLNKDEEASIRSAIEAAGGSKGSRYPANMMARLFGDSPEVSAAA